jgi:uncharacterized protein (DUF305 family)
MSRIYFRASSIFITSFTLTLTSAGLAYAQPTKQNTPPMQTPSSLPEHPTKGSPLMQAMDKMDKAMAAAPVTGNTDQDFVAMMIPHHQGAIAMAKVELAKGKDAFLRKLARNIVTAQRQEIREMKTWQAKHPVLK